MTRCPNCGDAMLARTMAGRHAGVEIDMCFGCQAFWFDALESPALANEAVLDLFRQINAHRDQPRRPLGARFSCPRCRARLVRTHDILRGNPIEYERCPGGDGRFTTFFQFLREKHFVRSLAPAERLELRAQVGTVRCSSCGAGVSLERSACAHCGAPLSVLDADAVEKRLAAHPIAAAPPASGPRARRDAWRRVEPTGHQGLHDLLIDSVGAFADWLGN